MCCEHLQHTAMLFETFFLQCASTLTVLLLKVEEATEIIRIIVCIQSSPNCALLPPMGGGDRRICPVKAGSSVLTPESLGCAFLCLVACVCQTSIILPMFWSENGRRNKGFRCRASIATLRGCMVLPNLPAGYPCLNDLTNRFKGNFLETK